MIPQGSPRLSLEDLTVHTLPRDQELGRQPMVAVDLSKADYPAEGIDPFSPLRIPEHIDVTLRDIDSELLRRAVGQIKVDLAPGTHQFPIAGKHHFRVQVPERAVAHARFELGPAPDRTASPGVFGRLLGPSQAQPSSGPMRPSVVRRLDITFSPALVLTNVLQTLVEAQALFTHRDLDALLHNPIAERTAQMAQAFGSEKLLSLVQDAAGAAHRVGVVLLRHVHAEPVFRSRSGQWELRLAFSGDVEVGGRVPVPFDEVVLPALILPVPFASLDELLSSNPFASADLRTDRIRVDEVIDSVRSAVRSFRGTFSAEGELPRVALHLRAVDQTDINVTAQMPSAVSVDGQFKGQVNGDEVDIDAHDISVGFPQQSARVSMRARIQDLGIEHGDWPSRLRVHLENQVEAGSKIPRVDLSLRSLHPTALGSSELSVRLRDLEFDEGAGGLSIAGRDIDLWPMSRRVAFSCNATTTHDVVVEEVGLRSEVQISDSHVRGWIELGADGLWHMGLDGHAAYGLELTKKVPCIPELSIEEGELVAKVEGQLELTAATDAMFALTNAFDIEVRNAVATANVTRAEVSLHERRVTFPPNTKLMVRARTADVTSSGLGELALDVGWDMAGQSCLFKVGERAAALLAPDLRQGEVTVHLTSEGRLWFSGARDGLYGIRYFNTLLNPAADPEHVLEILRSEEALTHVFSTLELLSPELADNATLVRDVVLGVKTIAHRAGIREVSHFIPRQAMARVMSLLLAGDESCAARIAEQVKSVTEARGLDVIEMKNILRPYLDEFGVDYEIDGIVRWLDSLMRPIGPVPQLEPVEALPLALRSEYVAQHRALPSAAEIYHAVQNGSADSAFLMTLSRLAVLLTAEQLDYILTFANDAWGSNHVKWLSYVHAVKRRVERIAAAYGGVEYALQSWIVATFVGEAVADGTDSVTASDGTWLPGAKWPPACALGPEEVATLLRAGLALDRQDRQTQINNRMLIDLLAQRPAQFMIEVMAELGRDNPNALSGILFAFLEQEQDHMREPVDLAALLQAKLGREVPRRRDFMAGGKRAPDSYYQALAVLAQTIMADTEPYMARKSHLQVQRHAVPAAYRSKARVKDRVREAKDAIAAADERAARCSFDTDKPRGPLKDARRAYQDAFDACSRLLSEDRLAFQAPWLNAFWCRNEEALKLLSVVRNYQEDIDQVRPWLHRRCGKTELRGEQRLLETVIDTLMHAPSDRTKLKRDPLVRLLIDPPPGQYDFSVVSCMGVITEGEAGTELEDAFARLWERRGVRVMRAHTGTAMSLEDNARRIIAAIEKIETPYGLIGYSQGCANALAAESMLRGGTPAQQLLIERLVCRNLLFSAFNGSAHGTFGSQKFLQAIIDGERFLKHYQVRYSSEAVGAFIRTVKAVVDSVVFVRVLGGVHSLTPASAIDFHREIQVVPHAPTSSLRAVTDEDYLPEALELTFHHLRHMSNGAKQDTQVLASDALGTSTRVINDATRLLNRCDMPSMLQASHHWSPLLKETKFVTTERDRERMVYESPKDRHVFPWIEVNARFGLIRTT